MPESHTLTKATKSILPSVWLGSAQRVRRREAANTGVTLVGRSDALAIDEETETVLEPRAELGIQNPSQTPAQPSREKAQGSAGSNSGKEWTTITPRRPILPPAPSLAASRRMVAHFDARKVDWRNSDPEMQKARERDAMTLRTAITRNTRRTCRTGGGLRNRRGELLANQAPGAIVWHEETRRNDSKSIPHSDRRVSWINNERYVTKGRYWLIVKQTAKSVWECPIFSNNNTGLELVDSSLWHEYASLVPYGRDPNSLRNQSPANKLVLMDWMDPGHHGHIRDTAVIHLAGVVQRPLDHAEMKVVGTIAGGQVEEVSRKALKASGH